MSISCFIILGEKIKIKSHSTDMTMAGGVKRYYEEVKSYSFSEKQPQIFFCIQTITFFEGKIHFLATQTDQSKCTFDLQIKINLPIDFLSFKIQRTLQEAQK